MGSVNSGKRLSEVSFSLFTDSYSIPFPMQSRLEQVEGIMWQTVRSCACYNTYNKYVHIHLPTTLIQTLADWMTRCVPTTRTVSCWPGFILLQLMTITFNRNALHCVTNKQPRKMICENRLERLKRAKKYLPPVLQYQQKGWRRYAARICTANSRYERGVQRAPQRFGLNEVGSVQVRLQLRELCMR